MKRLVHLYVNAAAQAVVLFCSIILGEAHTFAFS